MIISLAISIITLAANWKIYTKMGREGWEAIIPFYNLYVLFEVLYGNGWKFLLMLIPFYNIYLVIKLYIDLAHAFNKSTGFGIGLILLYVVFACILGFGDSVYGDGSQDNSANDKFASTIDNVAARVGSDPNAVQKIKDLELLHANGIISDEEFETKKAELLKRV